MARNPARFLTHERIEREHEAAGGSDRSFGLVIGGFFVIIGTWPLFTIGRPRVWALILAAAFLAAAAIRPRLLRSLNRGWTLLGLALHRITSPVVLGLVFYTTVTPIGVIIRALDKDVLGRRWDRSRRTYWIPRVPPGPAGDTMRRQF